MEPENTTQGGNKKKFLVAALVFVILLTAIFIVGLLGTPEEQATVPQNQNKVYTQEEQAKIIADLNKSVPNLSQTEKNRISADLKKTVPIISAEEKLRILRALETSAPQYEPNPSQ